MILAKRSTKPRKAFDSVSDAADGHCRYFTNSIATRWFCGADSSHSRGQPLPQWHLANRDSRRIYFLCYETEKQQQQQLQFVIASHISIAMIEPGCRRSAQQRLHHAASASAAAAAVLASSSRKSHSQRLLAPDVISPSTAASRASCRRHQGTWIISSKGGSTIGVGIILVTWSV